jgi:hypothetical protein
MLWKVDAQGPAVGLPTAASTTATFYRSVTCVLG